MKAFRFGLLLCVAGSLFAQRGDVNEGVELYRANCSNCHGMTGDTIAGVDLGHNKFRRASTDEELSRIIINGIPGTGMPPASILPAQATRIVAYLRSLGAPAVVAGNVAHGQELFGKNCSGCHRVLGVGSRSGPDLSEIGSFRKPTELEQSILDPNAEILPDNRTFRAVLKSGATVTGHVLNEDPFGYQVFDSHDRLITLDKSDLKEAGYAKTSGMPSFKDKLTPADITDIVGYLSSLKRMDSK